MERECKFADQGCEFVGSGSAIIEHIEGCSFGPIECPYWLCKEMMVLGKVVDHLKLKHKSYEGKDRVLGLRAALGLGEVVTYWPITQDFKIKNHSDLFWPPVIIPHFLNGHTFLLNAIQKDFSWYTWVSVLGSKKVSEKYKVKISTSISSSNNASHSNKGKVYSTHTSKDDIK